MSDLKKLDRSARVLDGPRHGLALIELAESLGYEPYRDVKKRIWVRTDVLAHVRTPVARSGVKE